MATLSKKSESAYAGFLNGYIAGNLSANSPELHLNTDKILHFLTELKNDVFKWNFSEAQKVQLDLLFNSQPLISPINNYRETQDYQALGETVLELVTYLVNYRPSLPSTTAFILKKIVYYYLNIAKTAKSTTVTNLARRIAEKFELSGC